MKYFFKKKIEWKSIIW